MRITVTRLTPPYHFRATNARGQSIEMDDLAPDDDAGTGISPMQLLIMAMGGCSGIDIALILEKQRQRVDLFDMELDAERPEGEVGAPYSRIHAHYILEGDIDPAKAKRAIKLSVTKYCGVSRTLDATAEMTFSASVNGERFDVQV